eukprot:scaffold145553_cov127-Phaeocystis_antarctica.AAC.1
MARPCRGLGLGLGLGLGSESRGAEAMARPCTCTLHTQCGRREAGRCTRDPVGLGFSLGFGLRTTRTTGPCGGGRTACPAGLQPSRASPPVLHRPQGWRCSTRRQLHPGSRPHTVSRRGSGRARRVSSRQAAGTHTCGG